MQSGIAWNAHEPSTDVLMQAFCRKEWLLCNSASLWNICYHGSSGIRSGGEKCKHNHLQLFAVVGSLSAWSRVVLPRAEE